VNDKTLWNKPQFRNMHLDRTRSNGSVTTLACVWKVTPVTRLWCHNPASRGYDVTGTDYDAEDQSGRRVMRSVLRFPVDAVKTLGLRTKPRIDSDQPGYTAETLTITLFRYTGSNSASSSSSLKADTH